MWDGGEEKEDEEEDISFHTKLSQFISCFVPKGPFKLYTSRVLTYW